MIHVPTRWDTASPTTYNLPTSSYDIWYDCIQQYVYARKGLHVYEYGYGIYVREVLTEAVDEMDMAAPELARRSLVGVVFAL